MAEKVWYFYYNITYVLYIGEQTLFFYEGVMNIFYLRAIACHFYFDEVLSWISLLLPGLHMKSKTKNMLNIKSNSYNLKMKT